MDRNHPTEEQRDAKIAELTEAGVAAWTARATAGEGRALADLQNTVLDRLSLDDAKGIFAAALLGQAAGNALFAELVQRAMYDQCEVEAIKQVERIESRRAEEARAQRIERRVFDFMLGAA